MRYFMTASLIGTMLSACSTIPQQPNSHQRAQSLQPLTDVTWEQVLPPELARIALVKNAASIRFNRQDQRFNGNDGCNSIAGAYKADSTHLKLGAIMSTKRACLSDNGSVNFTHALEQTTQYRFDHGNLILLDDRGNIQLTLRQVNR